jgi:pilus assembly protein FimV
MIVRASRPVPRHRPSSRARRAALIAASVTGVLFGSLPFDVHAQASAADVASASAAMAASAAGATQYPVKPGQSLSDIAGEITGSHDRAIKEKMSSALFDANPGAFMGHDRNRLKLGAVLTVPVVDLGDGVGEVNGAASAPASAAAAAAASALASAPASAAGANSTPSQAVIPAPAAPTGIASSTASASTSPSGSAEATQAPAPGGVASSAVGASTGTAASDVTSAGGAIQQSSPAASDTTALASAPAAVSAPTAVEAASVPATASGVSLDARSAPLLAGVAAIIVLLLLLIARSRRRRRAADAAALDEARSTGDSARDDAIDPIPVPPVVGLTGAADLESASVARDQSELNVVAASMENYDAAQSFDTQTEELTPSSRRDLEPAADETDDGAKVTLGAVGNPVVEARRAPFMPEAPAARHRDFIPPLPGDAEREAATLAERARAENDAREASEREAAAREAEARERAAQEAEARENAAREAAEREAEAREAAAREAAEREAEAREAAVREAAEREAEAREAEAREAAVREAAAREAEAREVEAREVEAREAAAREAEAREAATREAEAREAEAREAEAREAEAHQLAARASEPEQPLHAAPAEPSVHQQPEFDPEPDHEEGPSPAANFPRPQFPREAIEALGSLDLGLPPRQESPAAPSPLPLVPQPIAEPHVLDHQNSFVHPGDSTPPGASQEIESGTAGAASVAGLGASRFAPLSMDFDADFPASQTDPLPVFTPEQIATIARNKLELAVEYIELGDLSGARTLLQEVIESNDHHTRPQAAALLSTLAPLS